MMAISTEKLVKIFLKIRDKRADIQRAFDVEDKALKEQLDMIKEALLEYCKENDLQSASTTSGTFYRSARTKYWTSDWDQLYKFILENEVPELLERRIAQGNLSTFLEENPNLSPKGLQADSVYTISVRKK